MKGIYVKDGENPFEIAFPQWFAEDRESFFDLSDLPTFDLKDLPRKLLRF